MKYLLDTHTLVWAILETRKLSNKVFSLLESTENIIYASVINYWEICIKAEKGKLYLEGITPEEVLEQAKKMGFSSLELNALDASSFFRLKSDFHKDPFDRMIIWQAINNQCTLVTKDSEIKKYEQVGLKTIW